MRPGTQQDPMFRALAAAKSFQKLTGIPVTLRKEKDTYLLVHTAPIGVEFPPTHLGHQVVWVRP